MSVCVPKHIICDTYQSNFVAGSGTSTLSTIQTATRARSTSGGDNAPVGGALWRSIGLGPLDNNLSVNIIWQNIRRFNGFEFSTPPLPNNVTGLTEYVEIDVKVQILLQGQVTNTYYQDQSGTPLFTQTAEWTAVDTDEDMIVDTTTLCWSCTTNTTDTSDIIETLRSIINSQDNFLVLPEEDVQTEVQVDDGAGGTTTQTWNASSHDQDHIGPPNTEILNNGNELDDAANTNTPYTIQNIDISGATLPTPNDTSGPFYTLIHIFDSEQENANGSIDEDVNLMMYWGQKNAQTCYELTWIEYENDNPDCGMHIIGFDGEQNQFIVDDQVQSQITIGDTIKIFGPQIPTATISSPAEYGSYRASFEVDSVNEPGDGTTKIGVTDTLSDVAPNYQAVASICRPSQC